MNVHSQQAITRADSPKSESPVDAALRGQANALAVTADLVKALTLRLAPVLAPMAPSEKLDGSGRPQGISPVVEQVFQLQDKQSDINTQLTALLDGLTV